MDTRILKIVLTVAALGFTVYLFTTSSWGWGIPMILVTALMAVFTFRSVRLLWAFLQMRRQKMERAQSVVSKVNPDKLWKSSRGYYYFLTGTMQLNSGTVMPAEKQFRRALSEGLRYDHDKAAAKLSLAMIMMAKQKKREALNLIKEAKKLDKRGMLARDIKEIEQAMKKPQKVIRQRR